MARKSLLLTGLVGVVMCASCLELGVEDPTATPTGGGGGEAGGGGAGGGNGSGMSSSGSSSSSSGAGGIGSGGSGSSSSTSSSSSSGSGGVGGNPAAALCDSSDPTLIACFPFEGDTIDASGKKNEVTATGVTFAPGVNGQAASFNGASQVSIANTALWDVPVYTVELWYYQRSYNATRAGIFDSDNRFSMFVYGSGEFRCSRAGTYFAINDKMPLDTWTHVACVYSGSTLSLYVNGVLSDQTMAPFLDSGGTTTIGSNAPNGDYFDGMIDSVRVWNIARSANDICTAAGKPNC
jgi:hypothetical protein